MNLTAPEVEPQTVPIATPQAAITASEILNTFPGVCWRCVNGRIQSAGIDAALATRIARASSDTPFVEIDGQVYRVAESHGDHWAMRI